MLSMPVDVCLVALKPLLRSAQNLHVEVLHITRSQNPTLLWLSRGARTKAIILRNCKATIEKTSQDFILPKITSQNWLPSHTPASQAEIASSIIRRQYYIGACMTSPFESKSKGSLTDASIYPIDETSSGQQPADFLDGSSLPNSTTKTAARSLKPQMSTR